MSQPNAGVLCFAEKNCSKEEVDDLVSTLETDHNYQVLHMSFSSAKEHEGTLLIKSVSADNSQVVFETEMEKLKALNSGMIMTFACRLTVASVTTVSNSLFIQDGSDNG